MLWTGETLQVSELEKSMETYFNMLQGFLLLSHGSTVGAGPTLSSCVLASVKQVVDCSFKLLKESVSLFGNNQIPCSPFSVCLMNVHKNRLEWSHMLQAKVTICAVSSVTYPMHS